MKQLNIFYYLLIGIICILITSCDKDENEEDAPLKIEETQLTFSYEADVQNIDITATENWTVDNKLNWIEVYPTSGNAGTTKVELRTVENKETDKENKGVITFSSGKSTKHLEVIQRKKSAFILSKDNYNIKNHKTIVDIDIQSNFDYEYIIEGNKSGWVTLSSKGSSAKSLKQETISFAIDENTTPKSRYALIVFKDKNSNLKDTARIEQEAGTKCIIKLSKAGLLSELIGYQSPFITELTLIGEINGSDIDRVNTMYQLDLLDLKDARIVSGGGPYNTSERLYTKDDELGEKIFAGTRFKKIILPSSIKAIRELAFWESILITEIDIPADVKTIGKNTFLHTQLKEVEIRGAVTYIGEGAFGSNSDLIKLTMHALTPPQIIDTDTQKSAFSSVQYENCTLYVPAGSVSKYKSAPGWENFKNIVGM